MVQGGYQEWGSRAAEVVTPALASSCPHTESDACPWGGTGCLRLGVQFPVGHRSSNCLSRLHWQRLEGRRGPLCVSRKVVIHMQRGIHRPAGSRAAVWVVWERAGLGLQLQFLWEGFVGKMVGGGGRRCLGGKSEGRAA